MKINELSTEEKNINSIEIELQNTYEILKRINDEDKKIAKCVEKEIDSINYLITNILNRMNENTRIIYIGAGTSGRLGILDASECPPTYGVTKDMFQGIIAGGKEAVFEAIENAEDNKEEAIKDLKKICLTKDDVLIGLAASGRTPYVKSGLEYANNLGALTGSISCSKESEISKIVKCPIEIIVGSEIVMGSTRMKAGTAQKMVLNMISTTIMIKLGKVFSGYMIDVKPTNKKLIERAKRILMEVTNCNEEEAIKYLKITNNNVKLAIIMKIMNIDKERAVLKLKENKDNIAGLIHEYNDKVKRK